MRICVCAQPADRPYIRVQICSSEKAVLLLSEEILTPIYGKAVLNVVFYGSYGFAVLNVSPIYPC